VPVARRIRTIRTSDGCARRGEDREPDLAKLVREPKDLLRRRVEEGRGEKFKVDPGRQLFPDEQPVEKPYHDRVRSQSQTYRYCRALPCPGWDIERLRRAGVFQARSAAQQHHFHHSASIGKGLRSGLEKESANSKALP
jgi:hypothetical protein